MVLNLQVVLQATEHVQTMFLFCFSFSNHRTVSAKQSSTTIKTMDGTEWGLLCIQLYSPPAHRHPYTHTCLIIPFNCLTAIRLNESPSPPVILCFPIKEKNSWRNLKKTTIVDGFKCFVFLWAEKSLRYYNCKLCEFFSLFLHSCSKISHKSSPKLSSDDYEGHSNSKWITSFSQRPAMLKFFSWRQPCSNQGRNLLYSDKGYHSEKGCIDLQ